MPSQPRKDLLQQRRRARSDGDDEGSVINEPFDDSASEASLPSDADDEADADYSDLSEGDVPATPGSDIRRAKVKTMTKPRSANQISSKEPIPIKKSKSQGAFQPVKDTQVMLNGLTISDNTEKSEPLDFDSAEKESDRQSKESAKPKPETTSDKKIRDNEEYKRRLESDPAFIPTRGAFFMHDHRHNSPGHNGFRAMRGGRGRGRNGPPGPFPSST
jgi:CASC3/Barentsz eIF4AIII binding